MTPEDAQFTYGDAIPADWIWGGGVPVPRPVIAASRAVVTVGLDRAVGGWSHTASVAWSDVRGVIHAVVGDDLDRHACSDDHLSLAINLVRHGYLDAEERDAIANLLAIAATTLLPTPITALVHRVIDTLGARNANQTQSDT